MTFSFLNFAINDMTTLQLAQAAKEGRRVDALIFNLEQEGDSFLFSQFANYTSYAGRLLVGGGSLLFIRDDWAMLLTKDDVGDRFTMNLLDSPNQLFILNPALAQAACRTNPGLEKRRTGADPGLLAHILHSSIPVLTEKGQSKKTQLQDLSSSDPGDLITGLIDNFISVSTLLKLAEQRFQLEADLALRTLHECQTRGDIYPIFPRLQFLSRCYSQRKSFRLGSYMVASKLLTESQLEDLIDKQWLASEAGSRKLLGQIAVETKLISARQLEVLLFDQFIYGRQEQADRARTKSVADSIIGSLGTMSPGGLLQSLASDAKSGLLTVEHDSKTIFIAFCFGKITHAQLGRLKGNEAVAQFLSCWTEGIFVFKDKADSSHMDDQCKVKKAVETMLLDAALAEDQNAQILSLYRDGTNSILERAWDFERKWSDFSPLPVQFIDENLLNESHKQDCAAILRNIDGFCTVKDIVQLYDHWPTNKTLKYLHVLLVNNLIAVQTGSVMAQISKVQSLSAAVAEKIGFSENLEMLRSSVEDSADDNSSIFVVDDAACICVNFRLIKQRGLSIATICQSIDSLYDTYLNYCAAELDREVLSTIMKTARAETTDQLSQTA